MPVPAPEGTDAPDALDAPDAPDALDALDVPERPDAPDGVAAEGVAADGAEGGGAMPHTSQKPSAWTAPVQPGWSHPDIGNAVIGPAPSRSRAP
ncbi:hypothetical protein GCM10023085_09940 [Actinomadura viridis]|uniref:Uncharacterized protein n=1 Tax=Actinomadura viridis TaxID=58110 RepID=A0A931DL48_9ACTN|nr:hypothetical protein [Actinomadura viridis]MBG6092005.1 hypothetical protein [Actinomadura viridis]